MSFYELIQRLREKNPNVDIKLSDPAHGKTRIFCDVPMGELEIPEGLSSEYNSFETESLTNAQVPLLTADQEIQFFNHTTEETVNNARENNTQEQEVENNIQEQDEDLAYTTLTPERARTMYEETMNTHIETLKLINDGIKDIYRKQNAEHYKDRAKIKDRIYRRRMQKQRTEWTEELQKLREKSDAELNDRFGKDKVYDTLSKADLKLIKMLEKLVKKAHPSHREAIENKLAEVQKRYVERNKERWDSKLNTQTEQAQQQTQPVAQVQNQPQPEQKLSNEEVLRRFYNAEQSPEVLKGIKEILLSQQTQNTPFLDAHSKYRNKSDNPTLESETSTQKQNQVQQPQEQKQETVTPNKEDNVITVEGQDNIEKLGTSLTNFLTYTAEDQSKRHTMVIVESKNNIDEIKYMLVEDDQMKAFETYRFKNSSDFNKSIVKVSGLYAEHNDVLNYEYNQEGNEGVTYSSSGCGFVVKGYDQATSDMIVNNINTISQNIAQAKQEAASKDGATKAA